jgi:TRAP-type C4-dicarboxylate transport system permease small subunit
MSYQNLSPLDRTIRILLGLLMLWAGWTLSTGEMEIWPIALRIFAWFPLVTGALGWCPVYAILGLSTRKLRPPD